MPAIVCFSYGGNCCQVVEMATKPENFSSFSYSLGLTQIHLRGFRKDEEEDEEGGETKFPIFFFFLLGFFFIFNGELWW